MVPDGPTHQSKCVYLSPITTSQCLTCGTHQAVPTRAAYSAWGPDPAPPRAVAVCAIAMGAANAETQPRSNGYQCRLHGSL